MYAVGDLLSGELGPDLRLRELAELAFPLARVVVPKKASSTKAQEKAGA